ncbi:uncharacterized protein LOC128726467 [Anopheles nili]|uniref:uncharacterized protein LOC128726467 n=1 Tax=Anopheles nili TaxID=185578 RepID=UPI00237AE08F|nr:uncharacterized protein LOC128726467 [Anopheles nili]
MSFYGRVCTIVHILVLFCGHFNTSSAKKSKPHSDGYADDELFPIYECDERSREWTKRCLVPLTNVQLSVDLCGTGELPDQTFLKRCAKDLQILGDSCPQPAPVADLARNMQTHKPPPAPYDSPNRPKAPKGPLKDKLSL